MNRESVRRLPHSPKDYLGNSELPVGGADFLKLVLPMSEAVSDVYLMLQV